MFKLLLTKGLSLQRDFPVNQKIMSRVVKRTIVFSSKSERAQTYAPEHFIDGKKVDEFEYYGVSHLKKSSAKVLRKALADAMEQEPADISKFYEWQTKVALIKDLLRKRDIK